MHRLDFRLDDFTRTIWAPGARRIWEPRILVVSNIWQKIEIAATQEIYKPAALQIVPPAALPEFSADCVRRGLSVLPLEKIAITNMYSQTAQAPVEGQPYNYRVVICESSELPDWIRAWEAKDDEKIGNLLGFPDCCVKFFMSQWVERGLIDLTWPAALNTAEEYNGIVNMQPYPYTNTMLRWLGIRPVSHMPCSFRCKASAEIGHNMIRVGQKLGFKQAMADLFQMLHWPVEWSALHGIAEIKTPVCKVSTRTDATAFKYVVKAQGTIFPSEGARGNEFPFKSEGLMVTSPRLSIPQLNGFATMQDMNLAHEPILRLIEEALKNRGLKIKTVLDLGCGTGNLLQKVREITNARIFGVDLANNVEDNTIGFKNADMFDCNNFDRKFDLVILMGGRVSEQGDNEVKRQFLKTLETSTRYIVDYAYSDWMNRTPESLPGEEISIRENAHCRARLLHVKGAD